LEIKKYDVLVFLFYNFPCERHNDAYNYLQLCLASIWQFIKDFILLPKKKKRKKVEQEMYREKRKKDFFLQSYEGVMHFCEEICAMGYLQDPCSSTSLHPNEARYIRYYYMFIETHIWPHPYLWTLGSCHA
jgi:hypothetical protein